MIGQSIAILFGSFFVLLFAGVPISVGIGIASIITGCFFIPADIFSIIAAQRCFSGIDSFSLLALPFFMMGGNIMNKGGIAKRLVRLARLVVGKVPGYLAATNVLANMFFGAISGSSVAATSAMGSIMSPLEKEEGYDRRSSRMRDQEETSFSTDQAAFAGLVDGRQAACSPICGRRYLL